MKTGKLTKLFAVLLALALALTSCVYLGDSDYEDGPSIPEKPENSAPADDTQDAQTPTDEGDGGDAQTPPGDSDAAPDEDGGAGQQPQEDAGPAEDGYYYDVENVVLYLERYGKLPPNYITKNEARDLGWSGGTVEDYLEGAAIGGDRFGNYEGLLPEAPGRTYTECDIDTLGYGSRGSRRLVFSSDGLYFYTSDHYESFTPVTVEDGKVEW